MSVCDLTIRLEEDRRELRAGESVHGTVEVRAREEMRCEGLILAPRWSPASSDLLEEARIELPLGDLHAGEERSVPFELTLPTGPFSYPGEIVSVAWYLRVSARVPEAIDPWTEIGFTLHADPERAPDWAALARPGTMMRRLIDEQIAGPEATRPPASAPGGLLARLGCLAALAFPVLVVALVGAAFAAKALAGGLSPAGTVLAAGLAGALLVSLGAVLWRLVFRNRLALRKLGRVDLEVRPILARVGRTISIGLTAVPRRPVRVAGVTAELVAREKHLDLSAQKKTHTRTVASRRVTLPTEPSWGAGLPIRVEGSVEIPEDAPLSFDASGSSLSWKLTVRVRLRGGADWQAARTIVVHP